MKKVAFLLAVLTAFSFPALAAETYSVTAVLDSRTIVLSNGNHVRLLGVDLPKEQYAEEAKAYVEELVGGREIRLEFAKSTGKDDDGNLLAYVYVISSIPNEIAIEQMAIISDAAVVVDGEKHKEFFLNGMVLTSGYGLADTERSFDKKEQFQEYEQSARTHGRGAWAKA